MDEAHRPRQGDFTRLDQNGLAFDAAQLREHVAGGQAAAVDHQAIEAARVDGRPEPHGHAAPGQVRMKRRENAPRLDMTFVREEQRFAEPSGKARLQRRERIGSDALVAWREPGEAVEIGSVARMGDHERPVQRRVGHVLAPQRNRLPAQSCDHGLRRLALAVGRQHAPGPKACRATQDRVSAVIERHGEADLREQKRLPCASDPGAYDGDRLAASAREAGSAGRGVGSGHVARRAL